MKRLSDYYGDEWKELINSNNLTPIIDFAHTSKFRINTVFHTAINNYYDVNKNDAKMGKRSLTIRNVPSIYKYLKYRSAIEYYINKQVYELGIEFELHPMKSESYMYNLTPDISLQKNVDNWHYDYMPFVFVYMVKKSGTGGKLILELNNNYKEITLEEGEGIFMQGSQIKHIAERCNDGERVTLVLSFIAKNVLIPDNTHVTAGMEPYHKNEHLHDQFLEYKQDRLHKLMEMQKTIKASILRENEDIMRSYGYSVVNKNPINIPNSVDKSSFLSKI